MMAVGPDGNFLVNDGSGSGALVALLHVSTLLFWPLTAPLPLL